MTIQSTLTLIMNQRPRLRLRTFLWTLKDQSQTFSAEILHLYWWHCLEEIQGMLLSSSLNNTKIISIAGNDRLIIASVHVVVALILALLCNATCVPYLCQMTMHEFVKNWWFLFPSSNSNIVVCFVLSIACCIPSPSCAGLWRFLYSGCWKCLHRNAHSYPCWIIFLF